MWSYTFHDLDLPDSLTCVHVLQHNCYDPLSAGFDPTCVYCASEVQDYGYIRKLSHVWQLPRQRAY